MEAAMQSVVAGMLRTKSNATTSGLLTSGGVPPLRMRRDDMQRACSNDAKSCEYRRFWAKVDLMFDRADPLDGRALRQWLGGSDAADSHVVAPAASSAMIAVAPPGDVWSNRIDALEAKHRALVSSNRARLAALCENRRAAAESGARSRASLAGSVTALSLELTYRRMQAWKAVAHALRRGVCDKVPGFNRLEHEQASALPPSWLIRSGTRGKTARVAGGPNSPDVAPSSGDATPTSTAAVAAAAAALVVSGGAPPPPQATLALEPDDDTVCAVCFDGESTESNQIVFCDGCNIAIHQSCYGIRAIPKNSYFCERCVEARTRERYSRRAARQAHVPLSCCLCPCTGGALKRTTDGRWAHIVCGLWLPSAKFVIQQDMGPIDVSACVIASSVLFVPLHSTRILLTV
jgi:hypothetical protein